MTRSPASLFFPVANREQIVVFSRGGRYDINRFGNGSTEECVRHRDRREAERNEFRIRDPYRRGEGDGIYRQSLSRGSQAGEQDPGAADFVNRNRLTKQPGTGFFRKVGKDFFRYRPGCPADILNPFYFSGSSTSKSMAASCPGDTPASASSATQRGSSRRESSMKSS